MSRTTDWMIDHAESCRERDRINARNALIERISLRFAWCLYAIGISILAYYVLFSV